MIVGARARIGQRALGAEGMALGIFGGAGLAWSMANPHSGPTGAPIMWLFVTPPESALMLVTGVVTIFASLGRTAPMFSRIATVGWLAVTIACAIGTASHTPGPLGFDTGDTVLYGLLTAYNLALAVLFAIPARPATGEQSPRRSPRRQSDAIGSH
ncbi:hypothetical protein [Mycolicibacterium sp. CBMA 234]|uniref:hypothetical protein n=1 Tax=Mycolicibacterium sp. CBMA 234 TaxID=1918495 RepID=UPI0012DE41D1|nr:hypothetical protein [Mycolicibacterium sp. CBMA 234]